MTITLNSKPGKETRLVDFHGVDIRVTKQDCWVAIDADGKAFCYVGEPVPGQTSNEWRHADGADYVGLDVNMTNIDWTKTLKYYPDQDKTHMIVNGMKTIDFHGLEITVPNHGYVCIDDCGVIDWYNERPAMAGTGGWTRGGWESESFQVGKAFIKDLDWKQSVIEL
ncbi:MAG: hypothetical protein ACRCWQ_02720 [Bacilli bacterium]